MHDEHLLQLFEQLLKLEDTSTITIGKFQCLAVELSVIVREALKWRLSEAG